jgi:serine/threonine-protein kinase
LTSVAALDDPAAVGSEPRAGTASTRYEILGRLAEGGMAEIFLARSKGMAGLERHVVLKRVLPERARDAGFVAMFLDEARLAAQLHHPNVAQVFDIGKLGESFFFTMEYIHGENVRELLVRLAHQRRQLAVGDALTIAAGVAAGLHHAHERRGPDRVPLGIVHRDVSPANILVSYEGGVKVVDFGIAKANQRDAADTRTGSVKGKVAYMSPEQCKGKDVDRRSDVFSLGIVLWELLTGQRLYKLDTDFDTMSAIVYTDPQSPSHLRPGVPAEVDKIVLTAMAKDPARRFATAAELLEAIETAAVRTGHPLSTTALGRTVRTIFGDRPEPWVTLREAVAPEQPITVTGESFDIELPEEEIAAMASAGGSGGGQQIDEMLRRTNPIPRDTAAALREVVAARAAAAPSAPPAVAGERIRTRRGHAPARGVRGANRVSSPPVTAAAAPQISAERLPAASSPGATADLVDQHRRRNVGAWLLVVAIVVAFGGLAIAYVMTR